MDVRALWCQPPAPNCAETESTVWTAHLTPNGPLASLPNQNLSSHVPKDMCTNLSSLYPRRSRTGLGELFSLLSPMTFAVTSQFKVYVLTFYVLSAPNMRTCSLAVLPPGGGAVLSADLTQAGDVASYLRAFRFLTRSFPVFF